MSKSGLTYLLLVAGFVIFLSGCKSTKTLGGLPRKYSNSRFVLKKLNEGNADFNWLSSRVKVKFQNGKKTLGGVALLRIRKDSVIWASVSALLGIEIFRIEIRPDSVFIMNHLKKQYLQFPFSELQRYMSVPELNFQMLQNLLIGNPIFDMRRGYDAQISNKQILLTDNQQLEKRQLWIIPDNFRVSQVHFDRPANNQEFSIQYDGYEKYGGYFFPTRLKFLLAAPEQLSFDMNFGKYTVNKPQNLNFEVPASYSRK